MSTLTKHHNLMKPDEDDFFEVSHQNGNMDIIDKFATGSSVTWKAWE